jgi:hypothetical protein
LLLKSEGNGEGNEHSKESSSSFNSDPEPELEPEQEPEDDHFLKQTIVNKNLITVNPNRKFSQEQKLDLMNLKVTPASPIYNLLKDRNTILKEYKNKGGVYLIHNNVNGKEYVGSGMDLSKRLATYYFTSRLADGRFISNSILKYGHGRKKIFFFYFGGYISCFRVYSYGCMYKNKYYL